MYSQDSYRGCLIGGAAGDALGYAVEFMLEKEIFERFGERGITEYRLSKGTALFSDDTQMTLFTAEGLLRGQPGYYTDSIRRAYLDWLKTQEQDAPSSKESREALLRAVPELYSRRAPGNTCLNALRAGGNGTPETPINHSKGCGGVMRVAPIGLYAGDRETDTAAIARLGAQAAALTHGHPLGWLPAAALAVIIHEIAAKDETVPAAALKAVHVLEKNWPEVPECRSLTGLIGKALELAGGNTEDQPAIHRLGEGWVGDEALAIAVYCAAKYSGNLDGALIAAVNHKGDSDSTGAIAGNIIGAQVGLSGIPDKYTEKLEQRELILTVADGLWDRQHEKMQASFVRNR